MRLRSAQIKKKGNLNGDLRNIHFGDLFILFISEAILVR